MTTLDEQITIFEHNAEFERTYGFWQGYLEYRQLAEWLKDYKRILSEQKVGKWKYNDDMFSWAICSVCKHDTGEPVQYAEKYFKYCPNCGAKMEVE